MPIIYKEPEPVNCLPLNSEDDADTPYLDCFADVRSASVEEIRKYLTGFIPKFFRREPDTVTVESDLYLMEREYYAVLAEQSEPEVEYGRLFTNPSVPDSGLSDRGLTLFLLYESLQTALGLKLDGNDVVHLFSIFEATTVGAKVNAWIKVLIENGVLKGGQIE